MGKTTELRQNSKENAYRIIRASLIFLLFSSIFSLPALTEAATLFFSPDSGSYNVGQIFTVGLYVSSPDQAENASQGVINFPTDKLEAINISKTGSVYPLWVQEPSYFNDDGTVNFAGVIPNPGFIGKGGKILAVSFRAKEAGQARLVITKGSVLANDGLGTQLLTSVYEAKFSIGPAGEEATTEVGLAGVPLAPKISSPTHPNPENWYNNSNPKFVWPISGDVSTARIQYDKFPSSRPTVVYAPPISEKQLDDIKDGIWYFHAQLQNQNGWGSISHFRFQIDTVPPEAFSIKFVDPKESDNPRPAAYWSAADALSGLDYYKVKIGEGDFFRVSPEAVSENHPYILPLQTPGKRSILVQAYDKAGNYSISTDEFVVTFLLPPTITDYPQELKEGDDLIIRGSTYPDATVRIYLEKDDSGRVEFRDAGSNSKGDFSLVWDKKLSSNIYKFWADVTDRRGAKSNPTDVFVFTLKQEALLRIGFLVINYLSILILLIIIITGLIYINTYLWYRFKRFRNRLRREAGEVEKTVHTAFDALRENMMEHLKLLEKVKLARPLTKEENKIMNQLKKDLDAAEKLIEKEIEEIEQELK